MPPAEAERTSQFKAPSLMYACRSPVVPARTAANDVEKIMSVVNNSLMGDSQCRGPRDFQRNDIQERPASSVPIAVTGKAFTL